MTDLHPALLLLTLWAQQSAQTTTTQSFGAMPALDLNTFEIKVNFDKPSFRLGEPLVARIEMTNVSSFPKRILQTGNADDEYSVIVSDGSGELVPLTPYGQWLRPNKRRSLIQARRPKIAPLHSVQGLIDLTKLFKITTPGTYTLVVSRQTDEMLGDIDMAWFKVTSPPVEVIVLF